MNSKALLRMVMAPAVADALTDSDRDENMSTNSFDTLEEVRDYIRWLQRLERGDYVYNVDDKMLGICLGSPSYGMFSVLFPYKDEDGVYKCQTLSVDLLRQPTVTELNTPAREDVDICKRLARLSKGDRVDTMGGESEYVVVEKYGVHERSICVYGWAWKKTDNSVCGVAMSPNQLKLRD